MLLTFHKYQGTGNDFVILANEQDQLPPLSKRQIEHLCHRHLGVGADGLMMVQKVAGYDFGMKYYNADGLESSMCGNGGRCLVMFAHNNGIRKSTYRFMAADGEHEAEIDDHGQVRLKMKDVQEVTYHNGYTLLNTGSPHFVKFVNDVENVDVLETGRDIRYSEPFAAEGINVNFVETLKQDSIYVRTYERGVEDETMSCGTGVTAAALLSAHNENGFNTVKVKTPGGILSVEYNKINDNSFSDIWLCGPALFVFKGTIEI